MPENAGAASVEIANRVRDPQFMGTSQSQVINLLSYSQQVTNGILHDSVLSGSLTIQPRTLIYQLSTYFPSAIKVLAVTDESGRDLNPLFNAEALQWLNMTWPTSLANSPRNFVQVGADVLILYPGTSRVQTLTVKYSQLTPALATAADYTVLPNEDNTPINALTEALLLLKGRDLNAVKQTMTRFLSRITELKAEHR